MFDYECEGNMTIFDIMYPTFQIDKPIRLIELFGGIGSQAMALRNIGAEFEHYRLVEYDKYPVMSYNAIHGTKFEPTDIRQVHGNDLGIAETDKYVYIMTYSFPCQDLSVAGKMKGMSKGSGTRSGLLWEVERLLNETDNLPQVLLMENVPQVISDQNIADFRLWQDFLESKGYINYLPDAGTLNAKDYGVAQNRERCFMMSLLGKWNFKFPQPRPLTKTMADYLEDEVDEKYYINSEKTQKLINQLIESGNLPESRGGQQTGLYNL
jgi:DNA (cytosine-5)-methyltransferase 1